MLYKRLRMNKLDYNRLEIIKVLKIGNVFLFVSVLRDVLGKVHRLVVGDAVDDGGQSQ